VAFPPMTFHLIGREASVLGLERKPNPKAMPQLVTAWKSRFRAKVGNGLPAVRMAYFGATLDLSGIIHFRVSSMTPKRNAADLWQQAKEYATAHPQDEEGWQSLASQLEAEAKQMDPYPTKTMQAINRLLRKRFADPSQP
jgi:hypothetical protein